MITLRDPQKIGGALAMAVLALLVFAVTPAMAEFGVERVTISARNQNGTPDVQAGSHPYALTTTFVLNQAPCDSELCLAEGDLKDASRLRRRPERHAEMRLPEIYRYRRSP